MSCKSLIYLNNSATQTLAANDVIDFGKVVRRFGDNLNASGGNAVAIGAGYYDIDVNLTLSTTDAATVEVQLYKDGVEVTGAMANVKLAASGIVAITIPAVIREVCCQESTITAKVNAGIVVNNASIVVKKV